MMRLGGQGSGTDSSLTCAKSNFRIRWWLAGLMTGVLAVGTVLAGEAVLLLIIAMGLITTVHLGAMYVATLVWRVPVKEFKLFYGPSLITFCFRSTHVAVGCVPIGGYLNLPSKTNVAFHGGMQYTADVSSAPEYYEDLRPWQCIIINLAGPLTLLAVSSLILGPDVALKSYVRGFSQFLHGAFGPHSVAAPLLERVFLLLETEGLLVVSAHFSAKLAALSCLPLGPTNGTNVLLELARWVSRKDVLWRPVKWFCSLGWLVFLLLIIAWAVGLFLAIYRHALQ